MAFGRLATRKDCTGRYYGIGLYDRPVENYRTHANEDSILKSRAVDNGRVAYRHIIADNGRVTLISAMDNSIILDIDIIAKHDRRNITTEHSTKPYAATIAKSDVADEGGRRGNVAVLADYGSLTTEGNNVCHRERKEGLTFADNVGLLNYALATEAEHKLGKEESLALGTFLDELDIAILVEETVGLSGVKIS